ncbi:hypothetical protein [Dyadobacter pollutisoli]|uniref:DUF4402 domain-containing protein n=1 Tax=Dyadobacter pollutisoli TaxID=2910158 RepID=A0A9E8NG62_9BACT|nr:hypothetical protein [Dyadobacter pollutisoli]WAC14698.1 hypothetical protein ON006_12195 [Dyadobacter pollutisoli]
MKKYTLLFLILIVGASGFCQTIAISTSTPAGGTWSVTSLSSSLTSAGSNYTHVEESSASHTMLKVTALLLYSVSAHQNVTSNWDSSLLLSIKRTGNGTGSGTIANGTDYIQLTTSPQTFFTGSLGLGLSRDNIPVQYKITGLSVMLPVKTYTTTIQYTITGL